MSNSSAPVLSDATFSAIPTPTDADRAAAPIGKGNAKYREIFALPMAYAIVREPIGGKRRAGMLLRESYGLEFGKVTLNAILGIMRKEDSTAPILAALAVWESVPDTDRAEPAKVTRSFILAGGLAKMADALESILARRANITGTDESGEHYTDTPAQALWRFLGRSMTDNRARKIFK